MKGIGKEFSEFILGIGRGINYVFVKIPKKILGLDKKKTEEARAVNTTNTAITSNPNAIDKGKKGLVGSLSDKINNWYENLPSVKAYPSECEKFRVFI